MKILNVQQLKAADAFTITHEPIAAIDLMERAAQQCVNWLLKNKKPDQPVSVFCGKGGNGGDGLAIARLLTVHGIETVVYILEFGKRGTDEFQTNLARLHTLPVTLHYMQSPEQFPQLFKNAIVIDALYGFGLDRPLDGLSAALVNHLNASGATIIAIDLPSGLFADRSSLSNTVIKATHTLTFHCYKLGLLVAENAPFIGTVHVLDIGLHKDYTDAIQTEYELVDERMIRTLFRPRSRFAHKGNFGHALLLGGSYGKMGAVVLAASACLRSGAGLVTCYIPRCGYTVLQTSVPEAMTLADAAEDFIKNAPTELDRFTTLGIGPGMGTDVETGLMVEQVIQLFRKPMVLDADALNLLAKQPSLLSQLFENTILTPHPKEFERLFGTCVTEFERINRARKKAVDLRITIVLKGHHTLIALPDGRAFFNSTGNAGMAKGGSGDVLTGIITALLAQGYQAADAALLGVYLHGWSGDLAAKALSPEAMTAQDLVAYLAPVFLRLQA